jgi:hypothetical protein
MPSAGYGPFAFVFAVSDMVAFAPGAGWAFSRLAVLALASAVAAETMKSRRDLPAGLALSIRSASSACLISRSFSVTYRAASWGDAGAFSREME